MEYYDLGTYARAISTDSYDARLWFNRGLIWTYGYNHEEAIACYEKALECDQNCAMAHWGIAYAIGPNYNKPWDAFEEGEKLAAMEQARRSLDVAASLQPNLSPVETALLNALQERYPDQPLPPDDYQPYNDAYASAMRHVSADYPDDLDLAALFAEALMNRTPWQLWDPATGKPAAGADTGEAVQILESAFNHLSGAWDHPGLLHMYIHLMEMSPHPERALQQGDRLATLVPDAGHLIHMATHIDVLCGEYANVVSRNSSAILADRKYLQFAGAENFYSVYRCHNYHFKIYGAMFLGQPAPALEAAEELVATLPSEFLRPMADWFEGFVPMKQHVLIRFGRWQDILSQRLPDDITLYCVTTAMMHYARTIALANTRQLTAAEDEARLFTEAFDRVPESRMLFNNTCRDILCIAEQMLHGELTYHQEHYRRAFEHLRQAVSLDDALPYDEPWGWMQPVRHALGALLLEQGQFEEAEAVYRADLGLDNTLSRPCQHPRNVWSLHGLNECLRRRSETLEQRHIQLQLDQALARAQVHIEASCFCRQSATDHQERNQSGSKH